MSAKGTSAPATVKLGWTKLSDTLFTGILVIAARILLGDPITAIWKEPAGRKMPQLLPCALRFAEMLRKFVGVSPVEPSAQICWIAMEPPLKVPIPVNI